MVKAFKNPTRKVMEEEEVAANRSDIFSPQSLIEWERIGHFHFHDDTIIRPQSPPDPDGGGGGDWSTVHQDHRDSSLVFPPVNHEGLHHHHHHHVVREIKPDPTPPTPPPPSPSPPPTVSAGVPRRWDSGLELLRFKFAAMVSWLRGFWANRGFLWSFQLRIPLVGSMVLLLMYLRIRRRRRVRRETIGQLIRVIREKDEKIHQLLHQIARMNEVLLVSHHKVPISNPKPA